MADNVVLNPGVGGVTAAADEVTAGIFHQRVKLSVGADGSASDAIPVSNGLDTTAAGVQAVGIVGQLDDVATGAVTENQFAPVRISTRRALLVEGVASGTAVKVDGSAVTQPVSAADLTTIAGAIKVEDAAHVSGHAGIMALSVRKDSEGTLVDTDGDYQPLMTDSVGRLRTITAIVNTATVQGGAAHDAPVAGSPLQLGAYASAAAPADVSADGDAVRLWADRAGRLQVGTGQALDYDTGAGTQTTPLVGIALPASGGPVAGGTSTNPLQVSLANTAANATAVKVDGSAVTQPVSAASLPLPSGASTSAKQDTQITAEQAIQASVELIDDTIKAEDAAHVSGDKGVMALAVRRDANTALVDATGDYAPLQVDATGSLKVAIISGAGSGGTSATDDAAFAVASGSGTPIMGLADETSPDSVDEGDVGIVRMTLPRALHVNLRDSSGNEVSVGGGTQYTEDAAAAANPVGTVPILVRKDTPADEVSADGDNIAQRATKYGAAYVTLLDTAGAAVAIGGGTQYTEDVAAAADPIGNALILVRKDALAALTSADGDNVAARGTDKGELYVKHADNVAVTGTFWQATQPVSAASLPLPSGAATAAKQPALGTAGTASADVITIQGIASMTAVKVDGSGVTQPVSGTLTANLAAGTNNIGDVDVATVNGVAPAFNTGVRGAAVQRVTIATDDIVPASQSGTWTVQPGNTANTTAWKVDGSAVTQPVSMATNTPLGTVAHGAADSGAPLKVGAKASTSLSGVTLVSNANRTDLYAGVDGVLIVRKHANLEDVVQDRATNTDGASTAFAGGLAAPGAGLRLWITNIDVCNSSASFCTVDIRDGAAGAVIWTLPVPPTGGVVKSFDVPLKFTANTAVAFDASAATSTLTISANGFKSKV